MSTERPDISSLRAAIRGLSADDLADLLLPELDQRRLDEHNNPNKPDGLYMAAANSLLALLGIPLDADDQAMVDRLTAVGDGARVQQKDQEVVGQLRALAQLVDAIASSTRLSERAEKFARTLERRFGCVVDVETARKALDAPSRNGRITQAALAAGILVLIPVSSPKTRTSQVVNYQGALDRVRKALE